MHQHMKGSLLLCLLFAEKPVRCNSSGFAQRFKGWFLFAYSLNQPDVQMLMNELNSRLYSCACPKQKPSSSTAIITSHDLVIKLELETNDE